MTFGTATGVARVPTRPGPLSVYQNVISCQSRVRVPMHDTAFYLCAH